MPPKKSALDGTKEDYANVFTNFCEECDVLIVPSIVTFPEKIKEKPTTQPISKSGKTEPDAFSLPPIEIHDEETSCGQPPPPKVGIVYEFPENGENPLTVICKNIYIEYSLIQAIFRTLPIFPTVTALKIEDCCVSQEIVESLAVLVSEIPGKNIIELSLDGNEGIEKMLPVLIRSRSNLKYLSLRRCSLTDEGVRLFSCELAHPEPKIQVLNLNFNLIGDEGALALATALRTNRTLLCLSLAGNRITDLGASYLAEALSKFSLTHEETTLRRRKNFDAILRRNALVAKLLESKRSKTETDEKSLNRSGIANYSKKGRSVESTSRGKLSNKDKKRGSLSRVNSGEKFQNKSKSGMEESPNGFSQETNSSEILPLLEGMENELESDKHPYLSEISSSDLKLWCGGCWRLSFLNIAYNALSISSLEKFIDVVAYQDKAFKAPNLGLLRLVIQPGNKIPEDSPEHRELQELLKARHRIRSTSSGDVLLGSATSFRKLSSDNRVKSKR